MAFTIKIYEKNEYISGLLKKRLKSFFPDAYIVNPYFDDQDQETRFSDYERVLYDPKDISKEELSSFSVSPIRLTEDGGIIDCARFIPMIRKNAEFPSFPAPVTGSLTAVIPFVYSDVRDRYICSLGHDLSGADFNIRLDFTSKIRSLWRSPAGSNMTSLLEACRSKKFEPEDILKYCNMDDSGFLTPGSCMNNDDVYDIGVSRSMTLMNHAANLAHSNRRFVNVVAVVEGFRSNDLPELLSSCDHVTILLPAINAGEDIGSKDLIAQLTKALGRERISVFYADDIKDPGILDYRLSLGRQAV